MKIDFTKMNGCGNDFVIIDAREQSINLNQEQIIKLADRSNAKTQGCDQVIMLEPSEKADVFMRIYNPDSSEAQACGNATRCVAAMIFLEKKNSQIYIETIERILHCSYAGMAKEVYVNMGKAVSHEKVDLGSEYAELGQAISVNVGNPHCIFMVKDAKKIDLEYWGPKIETHEKFPERTNVEFVSQISTGREFRVRVWERGAGITKACGSGAMAVAWALKEIWKRINDDTAVIAMDGGVINVTFDEEGSALVYGESVLEFENSIEL